MAINNVLHSSGSLSPSHSVQLRIPTITDRSSRTSSVGPSMPQMGAIDSDKWPSWLLLEKSHFSHNKFHPQNTRLYKTEAVTGQEDGMEQNGTGCEYQGGRAATRHVNQIQISRRCPPHDLHSLSFTQSPYVVFLDMLIYEPKSINYNM